MTAQRELMVLLDSLEERLSYMVRQETSGRTTSIVPMPDWDRESLEQVRILRSKLATGRIFVRESRY